MALENFEFPIPGSLNREETQAFLGSLARRVLDDRDEAIQTGREFEPDTYLRLASPYLEGLEVSPTRRPSETMLYGDGK